ncbi:MAG: DNA repair protein RecO C-terminal domain-containing protein [Myxococcota bacterium]
MSEVRHIEGLGIILSTVDSNDDKIVRVLMEDDEVVPAIVKRGRRAGGKTSKVGMIQPLTAVRVGLRAKGHGDLALLQTVSVERAYAVVKSDLLRLALATCMSEVALHLCPDWGSEPGLYDLLVRALDRLESAPHRPGVRPGDRPGEDWLLLFELKALTSAGVLPPLDELAEVPREGRETLAGWLAGKWQPLDPTSARVIGPLLERALTDASGRAFRSRALLAEALR